MHIPRGRKSVPGMNSSERKMERGYYSALPQDPMCDIALLLFGQSADYRKLLLHLKPESYGNWVKSVGSNTLNVMKMTMEKTIEDGLGRCYKKLATLEEGVSKMN
nr:L10-interacting MYB domain-containing protein-like [Tanacetum cinerariifolium]